MLSLLGTARINNEHGSLFPLLKKSVPAWAKMTSNSHFNQDTTGTDAAKALGDTIKDRNGQWDGSRGDRLFYIWLMR